jgi:hypothetical protein
MPPKEESASVRVRDIFFDEPNILRTTELCVRSLSDLTADPLTVFGNVAIRSAISCTLTPDGLSPFSSDLRVAIPFSGMSVEQLHAVRAITCSMHALDTMRYKHPNGTLSVSCPRDSGRVFADAALVIFGLNALIMRAVDGQHIDVATVINVTQQRVLASINVHRSQLARANELTCAYVTARTVGTRDTPSNSCKL